MKIIDKKNRGRQDSNSGYIRVLGNEKLGHLISSIQSTVISNGNELENIIVSMSNTIDDIDGFIEKVENDEVGDGVYLCPKKVFKKTKHYMTDDTRGIEPDLLIFVVEKKRICKVIELKDGDNFDTKKSRGERENLDKFFTFFGAMIPFTANYYICCFNQDDKEAIYKGFKREFSLDHILTGRELCDILKIDYAEIVKRRKSDAESNFNYFIEELVKIPEVRIKIESILKIDSKCGEDK